MLKMNTVWVSYCSCNWCNITLDLLFIASEPNDIMAFGSVSDRFANHENSSDERYDKFNEVMTMNHAGR